MGINNTQDFYTDLLLNNQNVIFSTDTVWGIGGNAYSKKACDSIFQIKNRPADNPLIVHVQSIKQLSEFAEISPKAYKLINQFWPGPLTLIFQLKPNHTIATNILLNNNTVAVRMPSFNLHLLQCPVAAPSANISGYISPSKYDHALKLSILKNIPIFAKQIKKNIGIESTIFDPNTNTVLREGPISFKEIENILQEKVQSVSSIEMIAPGMKYKHYSPNIEVISNRRMRTGVILNIGKVTNKFYGKKTIHLKTNIEAQFYAYLHKAEQLAKKLNTYININYSNQLNFTIKNRLIKIINN